MVDHCEAQLEPKAASRKDLLLSPGDASGDNVHAGCENDDDVR